MDSNDFTVNRSTGPLSHPIKMDITHQPTGVTITGTGRDDQKLMSELIVMLTGIVAGYGAPKKDEPKTDAQVIDEALAKSTLHLPKKLGRPKKIAA